MTTIRADIGRATLSRATLYRLGDQWQAWRSGIGLGKAGAFMSTPEPQTIGRYARGRQLLAGNILLGGHLVEANGRSLWDVPSPAPVFDLERQGFGWLDDLAAEGSSQARQRAQAWMADWLARYGRGRGPGWVPDLTGRRLIRLINHAVFLMQGDGSDMSDAFLRSLAHQTRFLSRRMHTSARGLPRFEALTGVIYAGLSLEGLEGLVDPALEVLANDCVTEIDSDGGLPSRSPEDLLEVFSLLNWASQALARMNRVVPEPHLLAIERIAPTLRALRHGDGGLARFHGGGRGLDGRLEQALADSGVKRMSTRRLHMGYARLQAGRTSIIVDAAPPPGDALSAEAHASSLAFELTSGRRPVIVNCGSGRSFGEEWRRAGRATASHSTLALEGYSSSRLARRRLGRVTREVLVETPAKVSVHHTGERDTVSLLVSHDGYVPTHGLTHVRRLDLSADGRALIGTDSLAALEKPAQRSFRQMIEMAAPDGLAFSIRFHIHPDVECAMDMGGTAISLVPRSGEVWVFRSAGAEMTLENSVYMDSTRLKPRASRQIVLAGRARDLATEVYWTLAKAQDTPTSMRDVFEDTPLEDDLA